MIIKNKAKGLLKTNVRFQALTILDKIDHHGGYSNVLLDKQLKKTDLNDRDRNLLVNMVYGTLQRRLTLDYYLEPFIKGKKIEDWVRTLLRLSVYQWVYMDRIPKHALVNESVTIAKINGHQGIAGFVNGILRKIQKQGLPQLPDKSDDLVTYMSIKYSVPQWLVETLMEWENGDEIVIETLLASLLERPKLSVRITKDASQRSEIQTKLFEQGIISHPSLISPYGLIIESGDLFNSEVFQQGLLTVQDESSMLVGPLGIVTGKEDVLDACSAPGGKATHIRQQLTSGTLTALDISPDKLDKVRGHLSRMGLMERCILEVADAGKFIPPNHRLYDTIYLDAPCSGLGLLRRKPEIKFEKEREVIHSLSEIQTTLIQHLSKFVKPGGLLVYSTCTLSPEENQDIIQTFLEQNEDFEILPISKSEVDFPQAITPEGYVRILPHYQQTDGFYIARLKKK